jgi:NCAIR mutase (PurE)-related protein
MMAQEKWLGLLGEVAQGKIAPELALEQLGLGGRGDDALTADLGFARVDLDRKRRCGFPEVILAQGKTPEWTVAVAQKLSSVGQSVLATRVDDATAAALTVAFPKAEQDRLARTFYLAGKDPLAPVGQVLVLTAGTGDLPVAREAVVTAQAMGTYAELLVDIGVAGLHRLLEQLPRIRKADAIVVVAGMDGALPSVVGGLVDRPVFAVPTSIGYGTSFGGLAALLTMLNSCSAGVAVVNIDGGFKGGYLAAMVARQTERKM